MNQTESLSLTIEREIRAPRSRVFQAFTNVADLVKWFGTRECGTYDGEVDFREGGNYLIKMESADLTGTYKEILPDQRIVMSWQWTNCDPMMAHPEPMEVAVDFSDTEAGTLVKILHIGLPSSESLEGHNRGWTDSMDKLSELMAESA